MSVIMISRVSRVVRGLSIGTSTVSVALAACLLMSLSGCATTARSNMSTSADRLERNANLLADDVRSADYPSGYVRDVHMLADDARDFRRTVEDRVSTDGDVKVAFERLSRSYHAVRDEVDHSDSRTARGDLQPVTDSYLDIEREMGGYPAAHEHHASVD
jgi:hypothetical protein